jgi:hypothetical protein
MDLVNVEWGLVESEPEENVPERAPGGSFGHLRDTFTIAPL